MQDLLEAIRVAVGADASCQQKTAGVHACRTIIAALDSEPGKPIALPGAPHPAATSRVPVDQMLDLMIARLTTIAAEREVAPTPFVAPPRGLRVPIAPASLPRPSKKPATQPKRATIARKP